MIPCRSVNHIFLMGPKHSGKTSAGKALALLYSCDFIDLDDLILHKTGKTPRQLFYEDPGIFKNAETEAISSYITRSGADNNNERLCIIAAGGGITDNPEAAAFFKKRQKGAVRVYLNISAETAWARITDCTDGGQTGVELPPFLKTGNPGETHSRLHERRAADCLKYADIVIEAEGKTPQEIAEAIFTAINLHG